MKEEKQTIDHSQIVEYHDMNGNATKTKPDQGFVILKYDDGEGENGAVSWLHCEWSELPDDLQSKDTQTNQP